MSLSRNTTTSKRRVRELSSSSPLGVVVFSVNAGVYTACTGTLSERVDTAPHCSSGPFMYLCAGRMRFVKGLGLPAPFVIPWIWNYPCNY
jgi:hypothetical protein